jgi:hypothetical protein
MRYDRAIDAFARVYPEASSKGLNPVQAARACADNTNAKGRMDLAKARLGVVNQGR